MKKQANKTIVQAKTLNVIMCYKIYDTVLALHRMRRIINGRTKSLNRHAVIGICMSKAVAKTVAMSSRRREAFLFEPVHLKM